MLRLYSFLFTILIPLLWVRTWIKQTRSKHLIHYSQKGRLKERFAIYKHSSKDLNPLWIHTVSVGEFLAIRPLIDEFLTQQSNLHLLLTCTTLTGSEQILNHYHKHERIQHVYLPWDQPHLMNRFYCHFKPQLGLIMETEIWPNLLVSAKKYHCSVWLINARLSEKSANGYRRFVKFSQYIINLFSKVCVQNAIDGERFIQLGLHADKMLITGNIKFDLNIDNLAPHPVLQKTQLNWQNKIVLIASSTHEGEDSLMLETFSELKKLHDQLVLIIVPRHPERFNQVAQLASTYDQFCVARRSDIKNKMFDNCDILIGDSMGEMMAYYQLADIVIMGGSFINRGGHNLLEPAALGKAIIVGPYMFNFQQITDLFINEKACLQINTAETSQLSLHLIKEINNLIVDNTKIELLSQQAQTLITKNQGVKDNLYQLIIASLSPKNFS
ncbi:MAG: 3-deoxy-D-manno-octulosonic acid transferase [Gammaproteobacteria bacterium]|nr:3-deoxy-D-manno-octulosonic acid transferase [Gammaproteobacteria bacterium]